MTDTPTSAQIQRACRLYEAGADSETFRKAFANELTSHGMALAWCAAIAALTIDERYPFTDNLKH